MQMKKAIRVAFTPLFCFILSSCYFAPGRFDASLDVRADGTFTLRYLGEIVFVKPRSDLVPTPEIWNEAEQYCYDEAGETTRPCDATQLAEKRLQFESRQNRERKEAAEVSKFVGYNPWDEAANAKHAERLMQLKGWKRVVYQGNGVYEVDYQIDGHIDRDLVFPVLPDVHAFLPFITLQPSNDGRVAINAPGLGGGFVRQMLFGGRRGEPSLEERSYFSRMHGTFTLSTDADLLSSNGKAQDAPKSTITWTIVEGALVDRPDEYPQAELKLPQPHCCRK